MAFLGAEMQPGFDLFARQAALERRLSAADLVVTGEGAIDRSTLMGKGVGQMGRRCRELKIPCIGLAGTVRVSPGTDTCFAQAHALTELTSVVQAKARPAYWLERLAQRVARGNRNPKSEVRSPNGLTMMANSSPRSLFRLRFSGFFRTSDFGLRISLGLWSA